MIQPEGAIVHRVVMHGDIDNEIGGVQFFDKKNMKILEAGKINCSLGSKDFTLNEGDRLVGVKS
jgi:hypothetical protein